MKSYNKHPKYKIERNHEEIEDEACISYPVIDPNHFDLNDLLKENKMRMKVSEKNMRTLQNFLIKHKKKCVLTTLATLT